MSIDHRNAQRLRALQNVFPRRPLRVRQTGYSPRKALIVAVLTLLFGSALGWREYRELHRDGELLARGVRIDIAAEGGCGRSRFLLMVRCTHRLDYRVRGRRYRSTHESSYIGRVDTRPAEAIAYSPTDPAIAAPVIALEHLPGRRYASAAGLCGVLSIALLALLIGRNGRRFRRVYGSAAGRRLHPALVQIKFRSAGWRGALDVLYQPLLPLPAKALNGSFRRDEQPPRRLEGHTALAVYAEGAEHLPLLLDGDLARLDLDEHERQRLLAELHD